MKCYGCWVGNPHGVSEDVMRCSEEVWNADWYTRAHQCSRKRGYGRDELYCKQHAKRHPAETKDEVPRPV